MITETTKSTSNFIPLVINFAQREMRARYKRSLLGWLWSLLNPASTVLIYSLVFGVFLRTTPPVTENGGAEIFAVYLFTGIVVWNLFSGVINGSMDWLTGVMDLRKKAYFPTETAILGGAIATIVQTVFEIVVLLMTHAGPDEHQLDVHPPAVHPPRRRQLRPRHRLLRRHSECPVPRRALSHGDRLEPPVLPRADRLPDRPCSTIQTSTPTDFPAREIVRWNPVSEFVQAAHDVVYFLEVPSLERVPSWLPPPPSHQLSA